MISRYIPTKSLSSLVAELAKKARVLVPVRRPSVKESVLFTAYEDGMEFELSKATMPPKEAVLPKCETLLTFSKSKDPNNLAAPALALSADPTAAAQDTIVFACRPCDARGFAVLDNPFLKGLYADPYYKARRDKLLVITQACPSVSATCFCTWVGSSPSDTTGSDIIFTAVDGGYVFEDVTPKGAVLLESLDAFQDAAPHLEAAKAVREAVLATVPAAPDISAAQEKLAARFTDTAFWDEQTASCLSCGACTYMCPDCYCFTITDEITCKGTEGKRLRSWDTCMSALYTREASGHNARMQKSQRMRNRISHKFSTYPENWDGMYSCNGCGRCITQCPVNFDIRAVLLAALKD